MDIEGTAGEVLNALGSLNSDEIRELADKAILEATENVADAQGNWVRAGAVSRKWLDIYANNPEFVANIDQITQDLMVDVEDALNSADSALSNAERLKIVLNRLARAASWGSNGITAYEIGADQIR